MGKKLFLWFILQSAVWYGYVRLVFWINPTEQNWVFYTLIAGAVLLSLGSVTALVLVLVKHDNKLKPPKGKQTALKASAKLNKEQPQPLALVLKTQGEDLIIQNPFRSILCIGSAGSGKSESIERQLAKSAVESGFCGLLYDFKYPTLTNELEGYLKAKNGRFAHYNVNFTDLSTSSRVNPLHPRYVQNASYAREYSTAIINNLLPESIEKKDFWVRSCTDFLTAVIFWLSKEAPHSCTLPHAVAMVYQDERVLIPLLCKNLQCMGMIKSLDSAMRNESNQQLTGVISTLQSALSVLNTPEIFWVFTGNDFPLDLNNPQRPLWLSIGNTPQLHDTYSPLLSLIATVALKQMNQPDKHPSMVILDEAPTLFIPKLDMIPATARTNKVGLAFFAQDLAQIVNQYGQKQTDVLISNLNNQFFGRVSHPKTAEHVSKLFGKHDEYFTTQSQSTGRSSNLGLGVGVGSNSGKTTSQTIQERERIKPQEVVNFNVGQFCGVLAEGMNREFNTQFKRIDANPAALPTKTIPNPEGNFKLVHKQAAELVSEWKEPEGRE